MHFITGGAFNGKREWVKKVYQTDKNICWVSAYENNPLPSDLICCSKDLLILEGIEIWLKSLSQQHELKQAREIWNSFLDQLLLWEKEKESRNLVIIGTDITKGIVPLEHESRLWRDLTGWAFQDTAAKAGKADVIWYGLNQSIK